MIRGLLQRVLGNYLVPVEILLVLGGLWYAYEHVKHIGYEQAMAEVARAQKVADDKKALEIENAKHSKDAELADLARLAADLAAHEHDVRVQYLPGPVQPATAAGTSTSAPVVHTVPAGSAGCEERAGAAEGPNVFPVLRDLAVAADAVSAADREQYKVK